MSEETTRETTEQSSEPLERQPYVRPAILEEERLETYTLACDQPPIPSCDTKITSPPV